MGVLAPWFLFGLATLAVPLYLHLLRRSASRRWSFSSLIFFQPHTQSAVRQRRLRYLLLLASRLALLTLLVLAFAQPFVTRSLAAARSARLVLLVIDRSFSMQAGSRLQDAKRAALSVLAGRRASDRVQVMSLGSDLRVLTAPTDSLAKQRAAVNAVQADDSRAELSELVSVARQAADNAHTPVVVHLFSDMQRSSLPLNFSEMVLPDAVSVVVHSVVQRDIPNWTVVSVTAPSQLWGSAEDVKPASVQAVVAGFATPAADRLVSLLVNGKKVASQRVHVPAAGRARVKFDHVVLPHGFSRCEIRIDSADVLPQDDVYRFAIERSDPREALFIHAEQELHSALYFGNALAAADGSAFNLRSVTPQQAAGLSMDRYAFVVLSNPSSLPQALQSELSRYVRAGGGVLVALATGAAGSARVPVFDAGIRAVHDYAGEAVGEIERFRSVGQTDPAQNWAGDASQWSNVKFFYASQVDETDSQVIARLTDQTPLLLEKRIGEGRVVLFTSGLEALTNDLPLHPAFVAFVSQLAHHLSGLQQGTSARVVDSFLQLHAAEDPASIGSPLEVIDPQGNRALSLAEAGRTSALRLTQVGFYQLRRANGREELIAVNADPRESDLTIIPDETLAIWRRAPVPRDAAAPATQTMQNRQPFGLWWFIIALALVVALAQSWLADRHLQSTDDKQS